MRAAKSTISIIFKVIPYLTLCAAPEQGYPASLGTCAYQGSLRGFERKVQAPVRLESLVQTASIARTKAGKIPSEAR